jgi:hypothetical protein
MIVVFMCGLMERLNNYYLGGEKDKGGKVKAWKG